LDNLRGQPHTTIEQTFCHELVHSILYHIEERELFNNEKFVNLFAGALYQALETLEYNETNTQGEDNG
jgi:hypothetical protein